MYLLAPRRYPRVAGEGEEQHSSNYLERAVFTRLPDVASTASWPSACSEVRWTITRSTGVIVRRTLVSDAVRVIRRDSPG